jgi:hypothetical protein
LTTVSAAGAGSGSRTGTAHAPLVCGALGTYDRGRVRAVAAALGQGLAAVHEDEHSILMLDREPLRWTGRHESGLAWLQGSRWRPGPETWQEAAGRDACGLVLDGRRRFLHSPANGIGPLYWARGRGCLYFASRIDALVRAHPGRLSVDWDAWAAIVVLRYPLAERTPFAEISRLRPFSTLDLRLGRARRRFPRWPWAEVPATRGADDGADEVASLVEGLFASLEGLDVCPLSGGNDSRMLLSAAVKAGWRPTALTVSDDEGARFEEDHAGPVAATLGVPHELVDASAASYSADWLLRAEGVEHQFVDHPWLVPLARRIEGVHSPVPDGFALDTMLKRGVHFYSPETRDRSNPRRASVALFEQLRRYGDTPLALAKPLREPLLARAKEQFLAEARRFEGHPWQAELSLYTTRTVRGISCYPCGLLGSRAEVLIPGADNELMTAVLAVDPGAKDDDRLYRTVLARLSPAVAQLPSTNESIRGPVSRPRRWRSPEALAAHRAWLEDGPLAGYVDPRLREWLAAPDGVELSPDLRLGLETISLFHSWWHRYRDRLRDVDPGELLA